MINELWKWRFDFQSFGIESRKPTKQTIVSLMKKILTLVFILFSVQFIHAQETESLPTQSVFVELGGAGLPYSFNYDFRFDKTKMDSWGMRVGAGGYSVSDGDSFFSIPVMVNKLFGKGPHYFELGLGATFFTFSQQTYNNVSCYYDQNGQYICNESTSTSDFSFILPVDGSPSVMGTMNFGYRRIPVDGGFTWKVNLNPIFNNNGFWPLYAGIGLGYAF
jgi:hypothetical protein